jgi:hypothetical protein
MSKHLAETIVRALISIIRVMINEYDLNIHPFKD